MPRRRIAQAQSDYLVAKGNRLLVPVPSLLDSEMWERDEEWCYLTREGFQKLRSDIRAEGRKGESRAIVDLGWFQAIAVTVVSGN